MFPVATHPVRCRFIDCGIPPVVRRKIVVCLPRILSVKFYYLRFSMKPTIQQSSAAKLAITTVSKPSITLVALSVCLGAAGSAGAQSPTDTKVTLDMCATIAFRKNNEKVCNELEVSAKPQATTRGTNLSTVPTTSPNYGKPAKG